MLLYSKYFCLYYGGYYFNCFVLLRWIPFGFILFLSLLQWKLYCWVWNSHLRGRPSWSELTDVIKFFILQRAAATGSSGQESNGTEMFGSRSRAGPPQRPMKCQPRLNIRIFCLPLLTKTRFEVCWCCDALPVPSMTSPARL